MTLEDSGVTLYRDANILVAYSGTALGNVSERYADDPTNPAEVIARRQRLLHATGVNRYALLLTANAPGELHDLSGIPLQDLKDKYEGDIIFTDNGNTAFALNAADCQQLVFYSASSLAIVGLAHVSRKGAERGVHKKALNYMVNKRRVPLADVRVFFGPAIGQKSYAFTQQAYLEEKLDHPDWRKYIIRQDGKYFVAVDERILDDFGEAGLNVQKQVYRSGIDTGSDPGYFSHSRSVREGQPEGRNGFMVRLIS